MSWIEKIGRVEVGKLENKLSQIFLVVQHMLMVVQHMLSVVQHMLLVVQHMYVRVRIKLTKSSLAETGTELGNIQQKFVTKLMTRDIVR